MKRFLKRRQYNEDMSLNITSMADIFMILLVFLLKSYSTGISTITPAKNTILPQAQADDQIKETLKVEISSDSVLLEEKPVVELKNFTFSHSDVRSDGASGRLYHALLSERQKQKLKETDSTLLVMADQDTPYATLKTVFASAANSGFVDLKLVLVKEE